MIVAVVSFALHMIPSVIFLGSILPQVAGVATGWMLAMSATADSQSEVGEDIEPGPEAMKQIGTRWLPRLGIICIVLGVLHLLAGGAKLI